MKSIASLRSVLKGTRCFQRSYGPLISVRSVVFPRGSGSRLGKHLTTCSTANVLECDSLRSSPRSVQVQLAYVNPFHTIRIDRETTVHFSIRSPGDGHDIVESKRESCITKSSKQGSLDGIPRMPPEHCRVHRFSLFCSVLPHAVSSTPRSPAADNPREGFRRANCGICSALVDFGSNLFVKVNRRRPRRSDWSHDGPVPLFIRIEQVDSELNVE